METWASPVAAELPTTSHPGEGRCEGEALKGATDDASLDPPPPRWGRRDQIRTSDSLSLDWRGLIALAWAVGFGLLYARMMLESKAPGLLAALRRMVPVGG